VAALLTEGCAAGVATLRRALSAFLNEDDIRWFFLASRAVAIAVEMWDDEAAFALATRLVQLARDAGVLTLLPVALKSLANLWVRAGDFAGAAVLVEEADTITAAPATRASSLPPRCWLPGAARSSRRPSWSRPASGTRSRGVRER
jgi:hypothetical protein